jgi:hypothetical protein
MWERFELFWTAFEKFALFFSFIASLAILILMVLVYTTVAELEPPPPQPEVEPMIRAVHEGLVKIQNGLLRVDVPISHTVPIKLDIRMDPARTRLELVDNSTIKTGTITIQLRDNAGRFVGKDAVMVVNKGNSFQVKMDVRESVQFDVPIDVRVPLVIPLSSIDLTAEIEALHALSTTLEHAAAAAP